MIFDHVVKAISTILVVVVVVKIQLTMWKT